MSAPPCGAANGRPDFNWNRKKKGRVRFFKSHWLEPVAWSAVGHRFFLPPPFLVFESDRYIDATIKEINPPPPKKKQRTTGENHETFSSLRKSSRFFRWVTTSSQRQFPATTLGPFFFGKKDACLRSAMAFRYACISFIGRPLFFFRFGARCDDKSSSLFLFHPGVIFSAVIRWRGRACECVVTQFLWSFSLLR